MVLFITLSPCRPPASPLLLLQSALRTAVKIGFLCLCAISATVSPHNQLISKCLSSQMDSHRATGHTLKRRLGDMAERGGGSYHSSWQNSQKRKNIFTVYLIREKYTDRFSTSDSNVQVHNLSPILRPLKCMYNYSLHFFLPGYHLTPVLWSSGVADAQNEFVIKFFGRLSQSQPRSLKQERLSRCSASQQVQGLGSRL